MIANKTDFTIKTGECTDKLNFFQLKGGERKKSLRLSAIVSIFAVVTPLLAKISVGMNFLKKAIVPLQAALLVVSMASLKPEAATAQNLPKSLGNVEKIERTNDGLVLSTATGTLKVQVYSPNIIRVRATPDGKFDDHTYAVVVQSAKSGFTINESANEVTLTTDSLQLVMQRKPLRVRLLTRAGQVVNEDEPGFGTQWIGEQVTTYKKMQNDERFVGLGEKTGPLNRRGEGYINWNTDNFGYGAGADPIYQSLPFYIGIHNSVNYGLFMDNSYRSHFNFGASNNRFSSFMAEGGDMNYYLIWHKSVAKIIESYTYLTGRMTMPPLWALGLQQCRYSYYPEAEVRTVARTYREKGIPADAIVLDIHYMDKYKIWTWDKQRFPQPKKMVSDLKEMGFNTVVIIDPGIKVEKGYQGYESGVKNDAFIKYSDGEYYQGQVWPGWCHFPDFTSAKGRAWWGDNFKELVETGVEGFWNDMNEPATWGQRFPDNVLFDFDGRKGTHREAHNLYGLKMSQATFEGTKKLLGNKRPFNLTRAGFSGIQRYAAVWTGDNVSSDDHMMAGVRLLTSMGLTGVPFTGMDVGGFTGGPSKELFGRWVSVGAFSPFFRIHAAIDTKEADPWSFGERIEAINANYIKLRYKLLPYLYSTFHTATQNGMPVARSLAIDYTHDPKIYDGRYQNQYFFGPSIMVAPVESYKEFARVYLPEASGWYDFYNDRYFAGNQELVEESPIEKLPIFVKGGSIITTQSLVMSTQQKPTDTLTVHLYNGTKGSTIVHYEDDGKTYDFEKNSFHKRTLTLDPKKQSLSLGKAEGTFNSHFKHLKIVLHGFDKVKGNFKNEEISFVDGLPHFDPIGTGQRPPFCKVKTMVVANTANATTISW